MISRRSIDQVRPRTTIIPPREETLLGPWRAKVTDNTDKYGRLEVNIPEITRDAAHPVLAWPSNSIMGGGKTDAGVKYGSLFLPPVGSYVYVEFIDGDRDAMVWLPGWYADGELPDILATHLPNRRGLVTPSGHYLYFDDDTGSDADSGQVEIGVAHAGGTFSKITVDKNATMTLTTVNGKQIVISDQNDQIDITVSASAGVVNLNAKHVNLGGSGANKSVPWGEDLINWLSTHTHPTGVGPSGPPSQTATCTVLLLCSAVSKTN